MKHVMKLLLQLQELDLRIESCRQRELEIPKQKSKFDAQKQRLAAALKDSEKKCQTLQLEQREAEGEIEQRQTQIAKYLSQLNVVKKNEEYNALLHEIETLKKQIALKEERIITLMVELDEAKSRLAEDKKRVEAELKEIDRLCAQIDQELIEAVAARQELEKQCEPLAQDIDSSQLQKYRRIKANKKSGKALVPLNGDYCTGCNMAVLPQVVNDVLGGDKMHVCSHCGRLIYFPGHYEDQVSPA